MSGGSIQVTLDTSQHNYSAPSPTEHFIIDEAVHDSAEIVVANSDTGFGVVAGAVIPNDIESSIHIKQEEKDDISAHLIHDPMTPSISHHDYVANLPQVISKNEVLETSMSDTFQDHDGHSLVIEEAVEQEIVSTHNLEDEEVVRSKPLTAMYLQQKIPESAYTQNHPVHRIVSPAKSPGSSRFTLKPSSRMSDLGYVDNYTDSDVSRMRLSYNDPISVYHPNTGEIHFKMDNDVTSVPKKSQRSVGAILAASEAIKHQDIASEVEIGTYEVEVSQPKKRKRKESLKGRGGIDDDIELIRKAAKNVAFTLKGMKDGKDTKKRKKPRIRLTLTKSKNRRQTASFTNDKEYGTSSQGSRRGRRKKDYPTSREEVPNIIYQCEYCEKQFKTREKVRTHTKIHTEERAFSCDICGSKYRRREHLVRHYRRHTNERPYQCLECGKSYMRAEHLKRHSYDHSGEKPFECSQCPKAFTRHDRLIKHSLVHDK